jgi:hypothetical protein
MTSCRPVYTQRGCGLKSRRLGFSILRDHPKKACELMASRRFGRYLTMDARGRLCIHAAKVATEAKYDVTGCEFCKYS